MRPFLCALYCSLIILTVPLSALANAQASGTETTRKLAPVTLQLRWFHQFQFAGYYAAQEKGFYAEAGLDVTIVERDAGQDPIEEVLSGRAQFGVTNAEVMLHALDGQPLTVLAAIFQHSPLALLTHGESDMTTPHDLRGKRVKMSRQTRDVELQAMLLNEGMSIDQLKLAEGEAGKADYLDSSLDGLAAYVTNQPYYLEQLGIPYHLILPRRYGIDFYGDCLFTSIEMTEQNDPMVHAFADASRRGWEYAMQHPGEIIDLILERYPGRKDRSHLRFEAEQMQELILPNLVSMGHQNPGRWKHIAETFVRLGLADAESLSPEFFESFIHSHVDAQEVLALHRTVRFLWSTVFGVAFVLVVLLLVARRMRLEINRRKEVERKLKRSEEFHRTLFENTGTGTCVVELDGSITMANRECERLFNTPRENIIGKRSWMDYVVPEDIPAMRERQQLRQAGKDLPPRYDFRFLTDDKQIRHIELSVDTIPGTTQSLCSLNDITARIEAEQRLEETINELESKNEELERFAYTVSHDLKSPLITIKGFSGLLREALAENDTSVADDSLERIERASDTMLTLLDELLKLSRVGRVGKHPEPVALTSLAHEATQHATGVLEAGNATVTIAADLPIVLCERLRIFEVFVNLIENAARYGNPDGPTKIEIGQRFDETENGPVQVIFVRDNGLGIAPRYFERVFNLFEQLNPDGTGTGIGLALVKRIIDHHQGNLWVESEGEGHGSTFCFTLGTPRQDEQ